MTPGLNQAGVPLMVGANLNALGIAPGLAVHAQLTPWQTAGIMLAKALRAATFVPARFMDGR